MEDEQNQFLIEVKATSGFAKYVELDLLNGDCRFNDNYFDLSSGDNKMISVDKSIINEAINIEEFSSKLTVRSIFDIA